MSERLPVLGRSRWQAISLWQPWATFIVEGAKWIETRSWETKYRGPIAIHAAAKPIPRALWEGVEGMLGDFTVHRDGRGEPCYLINRRELPQYPIGLPLGAVVATADLVDCVPIYGEDRPPMGGSFVGEFAHDGDAPHQTGGLWLIGVNGKTHGHPTRVEDQRPYGDFTPGRWAWLLDNVRSVDPPIPARGRQQLWNWTDPRVRASDERGGAA